MRNIPISSYNDAMEWARAQDRINNRSENKELMIARKLAETYYKKGDKDTASRILRIAGQLYLNNKMIRREIL